MSDYGDWLARYGRLASELNAVQGRAIEITRAATQLSDAQLDLLLKLLGPPLIVRNLTMDELMAQ